MSERNGESRNEKFLSIESKRMDDKSTEFIHNDYTVGWVCALPNEQTAAMAMLDQEHPDLPIPRNDHNAYTLGSIGRHDIVITCLPMGVIGNNSVTHVATQMVNTFPSIKFGLMVGIGGGIPPKVRLGDVVVSKPDGKFPGVVQWDFGKAVDGGKFEQTGSLDRPPKELLAALSKLVARQNMNKSDIPRFVEDLRTNTFLPPNYTRSDSLKDILFTADNPHRSQGRWQGSTIWEAVLGLLAYLIGWWAFAPLKPGVEQDTNTPSVIDLGGKQQRWVEADEDEEECRFCDTSRIIKRRPRATHVHYGLIASGNQVIKDARFRDALNKRFEGNILCLEMEAAGLLESFPCIVIRGICDYADSHKNKNWQDHAAAVAAAFAKELLSIVPARQVEQMPAIKMLADIRAQLSDTLRNTDEIVHYHHTQEEERILDWLPTVDYDPQQSIFSKLEQGTGQWFLNSAGYRDWLETDKQTLFCTGIPGAGKTFITSIVIDHLQTNYKNSSIAYLYFSVGQQGQQTVKELLGSLLKQLVRNQSPLPQVVKNLYGRHKERRSQPELREISGVLQSVISPDSRTFFIIDALDECQSIYRDTFLTEIFSIQKNTRLSLFATSRPQEVEVDAKFNGSIVQEIVASDKDIETYVDHQILLWNRSHKNHNLDDIQNTIKAEITLAAAGMFLLASLNMNALVSQLTKGEVKETLQSIAKGEKRLDKAYEQTMKRIKSQEENRSRLAQRVLACISHAKRPLTTAELLDALAVRPSTLTLDRDFLYDVETVLSVCAGLVRLYEKSQVIDLIHKTTRDYFEMTKETWFPNAETDFTATCVTYLSFDEFNSGPCQTYEEFNERLRLYPLYGYAAHNWGHHARKALALDQEVLNFLVCKAKVEASGQASMKLEGRSSLYGCPLFPFRMTGLHLAAYFGLGEATKALLSLGHDPNSKDSYRRTPLSWAAKIGHETVVKCLLEEVATDVNPRDSDTCTPLLYAAQRGDEVIARMLLQRGAAASLRRVEEGRIQSYGEYRIYTNALHEAAKHGHKVVTSLLLEYGASVNEPSKEIREVHVASLQGHVGDLFPTRPVPIFGQTNSSRGFKITSSFINIRDRPGTIWGTTTKRTAICLAAENGHNEVVQLLMKKGAIQKLTKETGSYEGGMPDFDRPASNRNISIV